MNLIPKKLKKVLKTIESISMVLSQLEFVKIDEDKVHIKFKSSLILETENNLLIGSQSGIIVNKARKIHNQPDVVSFSRLVKKSTTELRNSMDKMVERKRLIAQKKHDLKLLNLGELNHGDQSKTMTESGNDSQSNK